MGNIIYTKEIQKAKPVLKWAGGKSQLLAQIYPRLPKEFNRYIEPFIGGGALFFSLGPEDAYISDSNPELVNLYSELSKNVELVIEALHEFRNTKEDYYRIRALDWRALPAHVAAARMIFLNKTCFNGLYRVNKYGHFNVPYAAEGRTVNFNTDGIRDAAMVLAKAKIQCIDYHDVLMKVAQPGDFVFLDPPYIPISEYSDFKRYTKEQFSMQQQEQLADDIITLHKRGCKVMLTNSNHPIVYELYKDFNIEVFQTKRMISKNANSRTGEDIIVTTYEL